MVKYALITGASSGFGEAISEALAKKGFGLILFARRLERLEALREKLLPVTPHVHIVSVDVQSSEAVTNGMNSLDEDVKSNIDVLVNNA